MTDWKSQKMTSYSNQKFRPWFPGVEEIEASHHLPVASAFTWNRPARVRLRQNERGRAWIEAWGCADQYRPFADTPDLYLRFAALAQMPGSLLLTGEVVTEVLDFVETYGLPRFHDLEDEGRENVAELSVRIFMQDAYEVGVAVESLIAITKAVTEGEFGHFTKVDRLLKAARFRGQEPTQKIAQAQKIVAYLLRRNLGETHPQPQAMTEGRPRIAQSYACPDLLSAIWLQVMEAALEERLLRPSCKGCGISFEPRDRRARYCSQRCQHAAAQRAYHARKMERKSKDRG